MIDIIDNYIIFNYYLINEVILLSKTNVTKKKKKSV